MDDREAELAARLEKSRAELRRRAAAFAGAINTRMDPFEAVRLDPVASVVAAAAAGVLFGGLAEALLDQPRRGIADPSERTDRSSALATLAAAVLPSLMPLVADLFRGPQTVPADEHEGDRHGP